MEPLPEQPDERRAAEPDVEARGEGVRGAGSSPRRARFDFERGWMAAACLLLFVAASLLYLNRPNAAFVVAALGISAWFLNVRSSLRRRHDLVKRGGRNWVPRGDAEDTED